MREVFVTILAGGAGTRLWPASTEQFPKQFVDVFDEGESLLQATYRRALELTDEKHIYILTNSRYSELVLEQLPAISSNQIIGEPSRNNTAACIAYAAFKLSAINEKGIMVVLPSDHYIKDNAGFATTLSEAIVCAESQNALVTVGLVPETPHTGYGYIKTGQSLGDRLYQVERFTEKPDEITAQSFIDAGGYYWNGGMFIWSLDSVIGAFHDHAPGIYAVFHEGLGSYNTEKEINWLAENYSKSPSISVDYAIMEKANNVCVVEAQFDWNDLGNWSAVYEGQLQEGESVVSNPDEVIVRNSSKVLVYNSSKKPIVINGVDNILVVETDDALLITSMNRLDEIKEVRNAAIEKFGTT